MCQQKCLLLEIRKFDTREFATHWKKFHQYDAEWDLFSRRRERPHGIDRAKHGENDVDLDLPDLLGCLFSTTVVYQI